MLENANIFRSKDTQSPVIPTTNITVPAISVTNITVPAITAGGHSINTETQSKKAADTETQSKKAAGGYTIIDFCINLRRFFSAGDGMSAKFSVTAIACHT